MITRTFALVALVTLLTMASPSYGQTPASAPADASDGLDVHGSVDVGYRSTTVKGSTDTFRQLFDLSDGPRIMGIEVNGKARDAVGSFADTFSLSASGLGGDPFPAVLLTVRKSRLYDLRANWRRSRLFDVWPATPPSIAGLDTQVVTDRHSWATSREIGNLAWTLHASNRLHFQFNYDRAVRTGTLQTTRSLDFVGAPTVWGSFARANPYPVIGPVDESANRITGGLSYGGNRWTVHYTTGYQVYDDHQSFDPLASPERSINVADPTTAGEPLSSLGSSQSRHLTSPVSELSYVAQPSSAIEWRGQYLFYRYEGPFNLDAAYQGIATTNAGGTTFSPYDVSVMARGQTRAPNHVVSQGVTYRPFNLWTFDVDYRYSRFATEATGQLGSLLALFPPATLTPARTNEDDSLTWRQALHTLDMTAGFTPTPALTITPGVKFSRRDVEMREDDVVNPATSRRERTIHPEVTIGYRPVPLFSARGSYKSSYSDASYTRLSPIERTAGQAVIHVEPREGLSIDASVNRTNAELLITGFLSHTRVGSLHVSYAFAERFTVLAGLDYQSFLGTGNVTFLRGTAPIENVAMRDREIDRVWQAGATVKVTNQLGLTATGNFDRTTGLDTIAGEPPLYGPMTFPYATGMLYFDIPRVGRVSVDVQRTYLFQELLPLNDFRATLVTVRYSRGF